MEIQERLETVFGGSYELVDSGSFEKLERFGDVLIRRPSSLSLWKRSLPEKEWSRATAVYRPKSGWSHSSKPFNEWVLQCAGFKLKLRLQTNGQVGIFPEHAFYLSRIGDFLTARADERTSVLNLFAYSGMASIFSLLKGAEVCHVDASKKALDWAAENAKLNGIEQGKLRLIADDALAFIKREGRRNNRYDIVILDPPSFSRPDAKKSWKLEDVLYEFAEGAVSLLKDDALLIFSCHHHALEARVLRNVFSGIFEGKALSFLDCADLGVAQKNAPNRILPAGANITALNRK